MRGQSLVARDVMVGVYLYLHGVLLLSLAFWLNIIFRRETLGTFERGDESRLVSPTYSSAWPEPFVQNRGA